MARTLLLIPLYLLCSTLPLLSPIGTNLEYEYVLAASFLTLLLVPLAGALMPARLLPVVDGAYRPQVAMAFLWTAFLGPLIALVPAALMFTLAGCPCSQVGFGFWATSLWLPSWVLAHGLMHGAMRLRTGGMKRGLVFGGVILLLVAMFGWTAAELWFNPQKRIVGLFSGFLHGPIYDDWIAFDSGILLARIGHLAISFALLFLVFASWQRRRSAITGLVLAAAGAAFLFLSRDFQSTLNRKKDLDELMFSALPGDGFTLRYRPLKEQEPKSSDEPEVAAADEMPEATSSKSVPLHIQRLHRDAQFHIGELRKILGENTLPSVEIYVYPNEDLKKLWFGGGATDVTDVVTPSIHITNSGWPHPTLRHELVHALASNFGYHGLGFHPNIAFTEGLAVALAPGATTLSLDDSAASLVGTPRLPDLESLFSPAFWKVSGGRAYTVAGSLLKYLIDKQGIDGVKKLYSGVAWEKAFAESRDGILQAWREQIQSHYDRDRNALYAEALFRHPGILGDACPHSKADLARSRKDATFVRLRQPIGWNPDTDYNAWLQALDENDKSVRLKGWRRDIRKAVTDRMQSSGRITTWREVLTKARSWPPATLEDVEMALLESDLARHLGQSEDSLRILQDLAQFAKTKFFGASLEREIEARLAVEKALPQQAAGDWRRYLAGWQRSLPEASSEAPWIIQYLRLRNERDGKYEDAQLPQLLTVTPDPSLAVNFHFEWFKVLGNRLMRAGYFQEAANAYERASKLATSGSRDVFAEHARRAQYYGELGPLSTALEATQQTSL